MSLLASQLVLRVVKPPQWLDPTHHCCAAAMVMFSTFRKFPAASAPAVHCSAPLLLPLPHAAGGGAGGGLGPRQTHPIVMSSFTAERLWCPFTAPQRTPSCHPA